MSAKLGYILDAIRHELVSIGGVFIILLLGGLRKGLQNYFFGAKSLRVPETLTTNKEVQMEKAYEVKDLLNKLKANGMEVVEEEAKHIIVAVCEWLDESGKLSPTPYDDMAFAAALPKVKELALGLAEKINPADNA